MKLRSLGCALRLRSVPSKFKICYFLYSYLINIWPKSKLHTIQLWIVIIHYLLFLDSNMFHFVCLNIFKAVMFSDSLNALVHFFNSHLNCTVLRNFLNDYLWRLPTFIKFAIWKNTSRKLCFIPQFHIII